MKLTTITYTTGSLDFIIIHIEKMKGRKQMEETKSNQIVEVYDQLIQAWNDRDAGKMSDLFVSEGEMIGFDGSQVIGSTEIYEHLHPIFEAHPTAPFVKKVKGIRMLSWDVAMLRAIAGMVPPGNTDVNPQVNTHHTLVVVQRDEKWQIELFQNTPAQFHGRPELVEEMTNELRELL
jgi:uncharacterized protein (TIGR02246 family)